MIKITSTALTGIALCMAAQAAAQDSPSADAATEVIEAVEQAVNAANVTATAEAAPVEAASKPCELHVWPTENYLGIKMGLLSGLGPLGALADQEVNKGKVTTVKDLMREFLGPQVQLQELEKLGYLEKLKLPVADYEVILHDPTPWNEDLKDNPELKAETKAINRKLKNGERITDSTNPCYAELITTHIFYHKAMMYGSNLFTGWVFHKYDGDKLVTKGKGQVKNPLEVFPPKEDGDVAAAQAELRNAYTLDFTEWVEKKSGVYSKKRKR